MCVGKCSRIVGPCLLALGMLSVAANILLLFPGGTSKYLVEGHISKHAKAMPGVWGGGITVLLAATHITAVGWRCAGCSDCGTRHNAFISAVLSKLALLGAAACFVLSGVGLTNGPLCFYNASEHGHGHGTLWGYPFLDASGQEPDTRAASCISSSPHRAGQRTTCMIVAPGASAWSQRVSWPGTSSSSPSCCSSAPLKWCWPPSRSSTAASGASAAFVKGSRDLQWCQEAGARRRRHPQVSLGQGQRLWWGYGMSCDTSLVQDRQPGARQPGAPLPGAHGGQTPQPA
ncbi:transmembrane 4 L6 family member 19 isoform 4-T6 [Theristicus caerulescens]